MRIFPWMIKLQCREVLGICSILRDADCILCEQTGENKATGCASSEITQPFCRPNELSDGVDTELCGAQWGRKDKQKNQQDPYDSILTGLSPFRCCLHDLVWIVWTIWCQSVSDLVSFGFNRDQSLSSCRILSGLSVPENWVRCCVKCTKRSLATRPWPKVLEGGWRCWQWQHASVQPNLGSTEVEMEKLKVDVKSQQARLWCAMGLTRKKPRFCLANSHIVPHPKSQSWSNLDTSGHSNCLNKHELNGPWRC